MCKPMSWTLNTVLRLPCESKCTCKKCATKLYSDEKIYFTKTQSCYDGSVQFYSRSCGSEYSGIRTFKESLKLQNQIINFQCSHRCRAWLGHDWKYFFSLDLRLVPPSRNQPEEEGYHSDCWKIWVPEKCIVQILSYFVSYLLYFIDVRINIILFN